MNYIYPKILKTQVNLDSRGYLIETFQKKKLNINFDYSILVSSKKKRFSRTSFSKEKTTRKITYCYKRIDN